MSWECVCVYIYKRTNMLNRERESQIQTLLRQKRGYKYGVYWQLFGVFLFFFFANWQLWSLLATFWSWSWGISSTGQKARFTKKQIKKVDLLLAKNQFYPHKMNHISKTRFTIKLLYFLYFYFYIISIIIN